MNFMNESIFTVSLDYKEYSKEAKNGKIEVLWADKATLILIKTLFRVIKSEMSEINQVMNLQEKSDSNKYFRIISSNFNLSDGNLHRKILKRIKKLKQFYFRTSGLTVHLDEIVEDLKALRLNRIKFWENLLKDFTQNEDFYVSKFRHRKK